MEGENVDRTQHDGSAGLDVGGRTSSSQHASTRVRSGTGTHARNLAQISPHPSEESEGRRLGASRWGGEAGAEGQGQASGLGCLALVFRFRRRHPTRSRPRCPSLSIRHPSRPSLAPDSSMHRCYYASRTSRAAAPPMRPTPPPHVITRLLLSLGRAHSLRRPLHSRPLHAPLAASLRPFHSLRRANHHHRLPVVVGVVVNCCKVVVVYEVFICCWRTPPSSSHIVVAHRRRTSSSHIVVGATSLACRISDRHPKASPHVRFRRCARTAMWSRPSLSTTPPPPPPIAIPSSSSSMSAVGSELEMSLLGREEECEAKT